MKIFKQKNKDIAKNYLYLETIQLSVKYYTNTTSFCKLLIIKQKKLQYLTETEVDIFSGAIYLTLDSIRKYSRHPEG